jgi:hypothetical protein
MIAVAISGQAEMMTAFSFKITADKEVYQARMSYFSEEHCGGGSADESYCR